MKSTKVKYKAGSKGVFSIENYTLARPFSNFLPGLAGIHGIPLWLFYVNRGQGVASFGVSDKDHAIMQFFPANRSYELTALRGFRTFIKIKKKNEYIFYEPFQEPSPTDSFNRSQSMQITPGGFSIHEFNDSLGIGITVEYFSVPNESFAALARKVVLHNSNSHSLSLDIVDGLPVIVPFGLQEFYLKDMSRTIEAWMKCEESRGKTPAFFYKLKSDPQDRPEFTEIDGAHFYTAFCQPSDPNQSGKVFSPRLIADPEVIFGCHRGFVYPHAFLSLNAFENGELDRQVLQNQTPCAFNYVSHEFKEHSSLAIYSLIGESQEKSQFEKTLPRISTPQFFNKKLKENNQLVDDIQNIATTVSASQVYDQYCRQTYMDNVLRGGHPQRIETLDGKSVFHVFSRKHGDLERDYNRFVIQPTYFSQGEGNYRDVNQNRRNDIWFEPNVRDLNLRQFMNLIQTDGYNPLVVEQIKLRFISINKIKKGVSKYLSQMQTDELIQFIAEPRTPGEIFQFLKNKQSLSNPKEIFKVLFSFSVRWETAHHGEGFWTEHWTYNTDLLESYLEVYPEEIENILIRKKDFTFYDNEHRVRPRSEKYCELDRGKVRQYGSVFKDEEKNTLIQGRIVKKEDDPDKVRVRFGKGRVYRTNLLTKLICVIANKYASLDPAGVGLEMEADKPDWYDALNGLPGMYGSTLSASYELLRCMRFVIQAIESMKLTQRDSSIKIPVELEQLLRKNVLATKKYQSSKGISRVMEFWNQTHQAKEEYWNKTRLGISGKEVALPLKRLKKILVLFDQKLSEAIHESYDPGKEVCPTYFEYQVESYKKVPSKSKNRNSSSSTVVPTKFRQRKLPPFLEGPVHALKVESDAQTMNQIYDQVRGSDLFDRKLGMYRVTSSLEKETAEIGRARVFSPGWLENQSVFLHMEYKWLLELLRNGLYQQFFTDFKSALIPFQNPDIYGRSLFENSTFIASSALENRSLQGMGFVARLSGSTAEFMDMWLKMNLGYKPFRLNKKRQLEFHLNPILPEWIFTQEEIVKDIHYRDHVKVRLTLPKNSFAFMLMGQTFVSYHNERRCSTVGSPRASVKHMIVHPNQGKSFIVQGNILTSPHAKELREGKIKRLEVELG